VLDSRLKTVDLRQHWLDGMWSGRGCMLGHARDARLEMVQGGKWEVEWMAEPVGNCNL